MKLNNKEIIIYKIAESIGTFEGIKSTFKKLFLENSNSFCTMIDKQLNNLDRLNIDEESFRKRLNIDEESFRKFIYDKKILCHRDETDEEFRERYLKYLEGLNNDN